MSSYYKKLLSEEDEILGRPIVISGNEERFSTLKSHMDSYEIQVERFPAIMLKSLPATENFAHVPVGVNLSHAAVLRNCLKTNYKKQFILVLEDDCRFFEDPRPHIVPVLSNILKVDPNFAVISLGSYHYAHQAVAPPIQKGETYVINSVSGWYPWGSHAWIYNLKRAPELIGWLSSLFNPLDHIMIDQYWKSNCWLMRPAIAYQESLRKQADTYSESSKLSVAGPLFL